MNETPMSSCRDEEAHPCAVMKVGLFVKPQREAIQKADEFQRWLASRDIAVVRKEGAVSNRKAPVNSLKPAPQDLFCVFVLGGDGTFLSAARWIGDAPIPIIGVKFGEVGFLAETVEGALFSAAETILKKEFTTMPRMRLLVRVIRDGEEIVREPVLNDIVINKGALARLARIKTSINDRNLTTFRADGLIVSTPTGSTGYSLAAGGPIIHPTVPGIVITPICPFTLTNRPIIVPDSVCIELQLDKNASDIMLTFDGQTGLEITDRDTIIVRKGCQPIHMITLPDRHYFDVLKTKLRWSGERI